MIGRQGKLSWAGQQMNFFSHLYLQDFSNGFLLCDFFLRSFQFWQSSPIFQKWWFEYWIFGKTVDLKIAQWFKNQI